MLPQRRPGSVHPRLGTKSIIPQLQISENPLSDLLVTAFGTWRTIYVITCKTLTTWSTGFPREFARMLCREGESLSWLLKWHLPQTFSVPHLGKAQRALQICDHHFLLSGSCKKSSSCSRGVLISPPHLSASSNQCHPHLLNKLCTHLLLVSFQYFLHPHPCLHSIRLVFLKTGQN